mmetsp:Transcript_18217/g.25238  ORF Transcript_18217/g.25238 Transcript_18217/m.25238 type:complete len:147 (-) Transcript_18217:1040-1480(-)
MRNLAPRVENVEECKILGDTINCTICCGLALLSNPVFCKQCQVAMFHKKCINKWFKNKKSCPNCRKENPDIVPVENDQQLFKTMSMVKLKCKNVHAGCSFVSNYKDLRTHEKCCNFVIRCKFCEKEFSSKEEQHKHRCSGLYAKGR